MSHAAELQTDYLESLNPAQRQAATWGKKVQDSSFEAPAAPGDRRCRYRKDDDPGAQGGSHDHSGRQS